MTLLWKENTLRKVPFWGWDSFKIEPLFGRQALLESSKIEGMNKV